MSDIEELELAAMLGVDLDAESDEAAGEDWAPPMSKEDAIQRLRQANAQPNPWPAWPAGWVS